VGKTTLIKYFSSGKTTQASDKGQFNTATDGIDISEVKVGNISMSLVKIFFFNFLFLTVFDAWDFAGQELYYTTHQIVIHLFYVV